MPHSPIGIPRGSTAPSHQDYAWHPKKTSLETELAPKAQVIREEPRTGKRNAAPQRTGFHPPELAGPLHQGAKPDRHQHLTSVAPRALIKVYPDPAPSSITNCVCPRLRVLLLPAPNGMHRKVIGAKEIVSGKA